MLLKIVYLLVRRILGLAILAFRKDLAKDAGLLVLRHENTVLRRHAGRLRYEPADKVRFAALAQLIPRRHWARVFPVTPATLPAWHRKLAARKYDTSRRRKPGRPPPVPVPGIACLAVRLAKENPLWGGRDSTRNARATSATSPVDAIGLVLAVVIAAASVQDPRRRSCKPALPHVRPPGLS